MKFRPAARAAARARWFSAVAAAQVTVTVSKARAAAAAKSQQQADAAAAAAAAFTAAGELQALQQLIEQQPEQQHAEPAMQEFAVAADSSTQPQITAAALASPISAQHATTGNVQQASLKAALSSVSAEIAAADRAARRRSLASVSRRHIDPMGSARSMVPHGSLKVLSRLFVASKRGFPGLTSEPVH